MLHTLSAQRNMKARSGCDEGALYRPPTDRDDSPAYAFTPNLRRCAHSLAATRKLFNTLLKGLVFAQL